MRAQAELAAPNSAKNPRLLVALVQNGISTKVTAGENRGETLANDRVTRAWSGPLPLGREPFLWKCRRQQRAISRWSRLLKTTAGCCKHCSCRSLVVARSGLPLRAWHAACVSPPACR